MKRRQLIELIKEEIKKVLREEESNISPEYNYLSLFFATHNIVQDKLRNILGDDVYNKLSGLIENADDSVYKSINSNSVDNTLLNKLDALDKRYAIKDTPEKVLNYVIEYSKLIKNTELLDFAILSMGTLKDNEEIF